MGYAVVVGLESRRVMRSRYVSVVFLVRLPDLPPATAIQEPPLWGPRS